MIACLDVSSSIHPRIKSMKTLMKTVVVLNLFLACAVSALRAAKPPNVLFISVDDLKPAISVYGDPHAVTPQLERLAKMGTTFLNAHCQQAICGPSRASVMTGLRPDQTRVWDLQTKIRAELPDVVTIPQHFKANGYNAVGVGKIFDYRSVQGHKKDDPPSWSRPYEQFAKNPDSAFGVLNPKFVARVKQAREELGNANRNKVKKAVGGIPPFEITEDAPDEAYDDGAIAATGVRLIEEFAPGKKPFFIAVGFKKPHLPFVAPKRYWDLYQRAAFSPDPQTERPEGSPRYHHQAGWELRNGLYSGVPLLKEKGGIPDETAIDLIHSYYACVSYIDTQIGKLLDALEASGEADNTIIALWSDHGFPLGRPRDLVQTHKLRTSHAYPLHSRRSAKSKGETRGQTESPRRTRRPFCHPLRSCGHRGA